MKLLIKDRKVSMVHNDSMLQAMRKHGSISIRRASHIEPDGDKFTCDLRPSGGPVREGFLTHQDAVEFELRWLEQNDWRR